MSPKWLGTLVRARQAQEDAKAQQLATAEHHAARAHDRARAEEVRVEELRSVQDEQQSAAAFVAASAAVHSAAAVLSGAIFAAGQADLATEQRRDELRAAALTRGAAENLQTRVEDDERAEAARLAQHDLDEIGARLHRARNTNERMSS
jgi:hypothetical protein